MEEIWKDIKNYEGLYQVSNFGNVKSLDRYVNSTFNERLIKGRYLKIRKNEKGYLFVGLSKKGENKNYKVHRLVAMAFIKNIGNKPCINHKDGVKTNNNVENLEWVTHKENTEHIIKNNPMGNYIFKYHANKNAKIRGIKKVRCIELDTIFESAVEACKILNFNTPTHIRSSANKKSKLDKAYGYTWEYVL